MEITLTAQGRPGAGKGPARRTRAAGRVPAILYGPAIDSQPLSVDAKAMAQALHTEAGANVLINLEVDGRRYLTMPREIQRDPLRGTLVHVDLVNVARDVKINADVPIHLVGEAPGVKMGGVIEHHLWELKVAAFPSDVPPAIEIDIAGLGIGDHLRVSDVVVPSGVEVFSPPEEIIVSVVEPQVMQVAPEGEEVAEGVPAAPAAPEAAE